MITTATKLVFTIGAAKDFNYDEHGYSTPDWKVLDEADNCKEAAEKFHSVRDYPIVEFHLETTWSDGSRTRAPVFGGIEEVLDANGRWQHKE